MYVASSLLAADAWELESEMVAGASGRGATAVAWRPHAAGEAGADLPPMLAVGTAGDGACVWVYRGQLGTWARAASLCGGGPGGEGGAAELPVSAIHWAPRLGRPHELIAVASGSEVALWSLAGPADAPTATCSATLPHDGSAWRVEFDSFGTWLAVGVEGDGGAPARVCLWRPNLAGEWVAAGDIAGGGALPVADGV